MDTQGLRISSLIPVVLGAMSALYGPFASQPAIAQHLDDYLTSQFDRTVTVSGIGLVTGLQKTGDVKGSIEAATLYAEQLARVGVPAVLDAINKGQSIALVTVTAEIDANWVDGLEYDCTVAVAGGGAESLVGGQLWVTPLSLNLTQVFGRERDLDGGYSTLQQRFPSLSGMIGTAEGRVIVPDTENQPTRGYVRHGVRVINTSPFVKMARQAREIVFDITNPALRTLTVVDRIVDIINHEMLAEGFADVAWMRSGAQIVATVPEGYEVLPFAAEVLGFTIDVDDIETPATIRWTPSSGVLVVSGNTRVKRNASISVQGYSITLFEPAQVATVVNPTARTEQWAEADDGARVVRNTLRQLKSQLDALRVPTEIQAAVLEQLVDAGMITAAFINTETSS